ncbi:MAG: DUF4255 domain-containing protein [Bacteroidota bacterium]
MIANVFELLAKELDAYFLNAPRRQFHKPANGGSNGDIVLDPQSPPPASFVDNDPSVQIIELLRQEDQQEFIKFPLNRVTPILINMEEETQLRKADRFSRMSSNGLRAHVQPDIRLNLYILFVSHFYDYTDALHYISLIIKYFQHKPIFDHRNSPELSDEIEELIVELVTLPFAQQNEVWSSLRSAYHPSVLYKVKMLVFQDQPVSGQSVSTTQVGHDAKQIDSDS